MADISEFVNSKDGVPMQFDNGLPRVDGKYVPICFKSLYDSEGNVSLCLWIDFLFWWLFFQVAFLCVLEFGKQPPYCGWIEGGKLIWHVQFSRVSRFQLRFEF